MRHKEYPSNLDPDLTPCIVQYIHSDKRNRSHLHENMEPSCSCFNDYHYGANAATAYHFVQGGSTMCMRQSKIYTLFFINPLQKSGRHQMVLLSVLVTYWNCCRSLRSVTRSDAYRYQVGYLPKFPFSVTSKENT